jgi:hypothetical protein
MTWVGDLETFARLETDFDIFGEAMRQQHPDTISIQLQRFAYPSLDVVTTITDDVRTQIGDHCSHLH